MLILNGELAVVDIRKLRDYCLNLNHDTGKHKARLFLSILGMTAEDAEDLRRILLGVVVTHEAVEILASGAAFEVEFSDRQGRTYESVGLRPTQFMVLHFEPELPRMIAQ